MSTEDAEQLALDGLAPRKRRKRASTPKTPAAEHPIAQVVLDIQATHLGQTFDYYVEEKYSEDAQPGVMVRVRFGGQRVNGIVWNRTDTSETPESSLRFIERVVSDRVLVPASMRNDVTLIADAFGGTRANILRLAVPARVARVEQEQRLGNRTNIEKNRRRESLAEVERESYEQLQRQYGNINLLHEALESQRFQSFVFDPLPGADHWRQCAAWMVVLALLQGKPAVLVLPTMREIEDMAETLQAIGLRPFAPTQSSDGAYDGDFAILNAQMAPVERYRAYLATSEGQVRCVIGTRAAMYAPVDGNALFFILDDVCYQDADGMMPYANARGVLRLRAKSHNGVFVAMANARSVQSQWETDAAHVRTTQVSGFSTPIHAFPAVTKEASPWIRWLNRDELARLADATIVVESVGKRPGVVEHSARWHQRGIELCEMPPPGEMFVLYRAFGTIVGRIRAMPLVWLRHSAMGVPCMPGRAYASGSCRGRGNRTGTEPAVSGRSHCAFNAKPAAWHCFRYWIYATAGHRHSRCRTPCAWAESFGV